jgi:small-conductance mechanosensitive channel
VFGQPDNAVGDNAQQMRGQFRGVPDICRSSVLIRCRVGADALALAVLLSAFTLHNAQSQQPGEQPPTEAVPPPKRSVPVNPASNDAEIAKRLAGILQSTGWFERPQVSVAQGVAFLDGRTRNQEHRSWAGALAENTEDVVAVVNRIEVATDVESTLERATNELTDVYLRVVRSWPVVLVVALILLATWVIAKAAMALVRRYFVYRVASPLLRSILVRAFTIPIYVLGIYFVLQIAGLTRLALTILGGTGILGIIVGFAFRDIAENFLASVLLSSRNPFRSGDLIEIAGHTGIVQNLNTRSTVLLTLDGNHIQIPNATVYKSTITNFSSNPTRMATFVVGIGYDASAAEAQSLMLNILKEHPAVRSAPEPLVLLEELGAATMNLRASYWFDSAIYAPNRINSALLRQTKNALVRGGISLPDPAREVIFPTGVPVTLVKEAPQEADSDHGKAQRVSEARQSQTDNTDPATSAEGNLSSEVNAVTKHSRGEVPEAQENLLDNSRSD